MAANPTPPANINFFWPIMAIAALAVGTAAIIQHAPLPTTTATTKSKKPVPTKLINSKIKSIVTPKSSLTSSLSPARDLKGTWSSSLSRKGLQVYGKLATAGGTTMVYEDGDMELVIDSVTNNVAHGKIRYTNLCATVEVTVPNLPSISRQQCSGDTGYQPVAIRVSSSALDFGTITTSGATFTMKGNYTTDLMSGTMTMTLPAYGVLKGEFHLMRKS